MEPIILLYPLHFCTHWNNNCVAFVYINEVVVELKDFSTLLNADGMGR